MPKVDESIDVRVRSSRRTTSGRSSRSSRSSWKGSSPSSSSTTGVKWVAEVRGKTREWTTEITEQRPDEKIAWKTIGGEVKNDGIVTFEQLGNDQTPINVEMDVEGESGTENVAGDLLGVVETQVRGDLERFKLIESRGEGGAWLGEVQDGETQ